MSSVTPTRASLDRFLRSLNVSGLTLDLGCGGGRYSEFFPTRVGLDIDGQRGIDVMGDAHWLPFREGSFDNVLCTEVLEHLFEPWRTIQEIRRVLRPGGTCILTTRFCYPIHDSPRDFYRFTEFALQRLFANWDIMYLKPDTDALSSAMVILWYGLESADHNSLRRLFWRPCWIALWKIYFRLYPRLKWAYPSQIAPTGYHLIARKPTLEKRLDQS